MTPTQHKTNSGVIEPPLGVALEQYGPIPFTPVRFLDSPAMSTFWTPSAEELSLLIAGHPVCVTIGCEYVCPVVAVGVALR